MITPVIFNTAMQKNVLKIVPNGFLFDDFQLQTSI